MDYTKKYVMKLEAEMKRLREENEELRNRRDWPSELHEQYIVVLDERDALQERIEELEDEIALLK